MNLIKKKNIIIYGIIFILFLISFIVLSNSYFFYGNPVVKIKNAEIIKNYYVTGSNGKSEECFIQELTGIVKNGSYKGESVKFTNSYSKSGLKSEKYKKGDTLFTSITEKDDDTLSVSVLYERRDNYLYLISGIFVILLFIVSKRKGVVTFISLIANTVIFYIGLNYYNNSRMFTTVWILASVLFCVLTLLLVAGFHKKTLGAIISSVLSVLIVCLIYRFTVYKDKNIWYETMSYVITPLPLKKIYMASTVLCMMGAVMDVAITINSSISELTTASSNLNIKQLISSTKIIGHDIMGTMINVLFFSYLSCMLTSIILKLHSGYRLVTILSGDSLFDIVRFLIGAIGIVIAIPVSGFIAILLFKERRCKKCQAC